MPPPSRGNKSTKLVDKSGDKDAGQRKNPLFPAPFIDLPVSWADFQAFEFKRKNFEKAANP
jgi:hypothetical protein